MGTRPAAVAGTFYPASPRRLAELVDRLLAEVDVPAGEPRPVALIVPHAGYRYSGPVAACGYARLARPGAPIRRVVLLGPSHFVPITGMAMPAAAAFETPLGQVPIDVAARAELAGRLPAAEVCEAPHAIEHSTEVQLPFLQRLLTDEWSLLPIAVRSGDEAGIPEAIDAVWDDGTLLVVSTDLSHYYDAATARRLDLQTANAVVARTPAAIGGRAACGIGALRGLLHWVRRHELSVQLLNLRTSADTAGEPTRVVGYGAFAVTGCRG